MSMNSTAKQLKNLERRKSWKPGQSGNPGGRPKKADTITSLVRELLEKDAGAGDGKTNAGLVAEVIVNQLKDKNSKAFAQVLKDQQDRLEGKVTDHMSVTQETTVRFVVGKGYEKAEDKGE
ncbi:hypothetical protein LCGC14_1553360 [marine sediment metagenome]|uniref:DUF5681 domain-containing protein n=1 Tax=marine sediment metagenome TaxID=412755 RepID=A0A0F9L5U3_9ZZZZ